MIRTGTATSAVLPGAISVQMRRIAGLYAVEKAVRGFAPDARLIAPIVAAMKPWLEKPFSRISSGSKLAEHPLYILGAWDGLLSSKCAISSVV